jgi:hypothetical protein
LVLAASTVRFCVTAERVWLRLFETVEDLFEETDGIV